MAVDTAVCKLLANSCRNRGCEWLVHTQLSQVISLLALTLRFNSEVMSLAVFAWTWVSTAAPEWLIPLTSRVVSAWCWSVDRRMGLFSAGGEGG